MNANFLDIGLSYAIDTPIFTLGPKGTSSEFASVHFCNWMKKYYSNSDHEINLKQTYEEARDNLTGQNGLLIVANAYSRINDFYMDPRLSLLATFVLDTPPYGLAVANNHLLKEKFNIASHPAPIPLIEELLPQHLEVEQVIQMPSTSAAAKAVASGDVDMALTTEIAARINKLTFISKCRPIHMLWSVFGTVKNYN
ncbi:bacilysin biosynthesis protein BacA [Thalassotalea euphylliae]|uniref:Bacilysin biosynthesis protein BacA n=1 Tax=Thalassotalea euphylliae TaxID=1655234 RepID=A0A3E0U306_9GAMM|nr:bacilysin biosynthesis protein BacA [Thalassotalea euphylliae]REL31308.1 bacilysin biosynthesis protein BacA [Thalassotalea euphylliae]